MKNTNGEMKLMDMHDKPSRLEAADIIVKHMVYLSGFSLSAYIRCRSDGVHSIPCWHVEGYPGYVNKVTAAEMIWWNAGC